MDTGRRSRGCEGGGQVQGVGVGVHKARHDYYSYEDGCKADAEAARARDNFSCFGGLHRGAVSVIHSPLPLGWARPQTSMRIA